MEEQAIDLPYMAALYGDIRRVIETARSINITALNAMVMARQSGELAVGFGVVSSELRRFSDRLTTLMKTLNARVSRLVQEVANQRKLLRAFRQFDTAAMHGAVVESQLHVAMARREQGLQEIAARITLQLKEVQKILDEARRLCQTGEYVSHRAKIEAVYGGDTAAALIQVSRQVEGTLQVILESLDSLKEKALKI